MLARIQQTAPAMALAAALCSPMMAQAEWDADLPSYQAQDYFKTLTNTPYKRFVELSEGTHSVMLEKNRMQFFREIMNFLDEADPQALR